MKNSNDQFTEVKVKVLSHAGPACVTCKQPTTEIEVVEDCIDMMSGDKGIYCPNC